jgi:uncharacterized protein (TIGR00255 family)
MLMSMTAYGEGSSAENPPLVKASVKTLNHRYLDVSMRGLENYPHLELHCRQLIQTSFARGRVEVDISFERTAEAPITCDIQLAKSYYHVLNQLADELQLLDQPSLTHLINLEGVLRPVELPEMVVQPAVEAALNAAISAARAERQREGQALRAELERCLAALEDETKAVEAYRPQVLKEYHEKLRQRVQELSEGVVLDAGRLEAEVALIAERADITEELSRLRIHLQAARQALDAPEPTGRTLDFLAQELNREVNTLGAKARDGEIARRTITMKSLIDQLREQVRNIE